MTLKIRLGTTSCDFNVWREGMGAVFAGPFAFDAETTFDDTNPSHVPSYVIGAACDGSSGYFIPAGRCPAFLAAHDGVPLVFHNATFDLKVLQREAAGIDLYSFVERGLVWDTMLLHRLYKLGREGHPANRTGESTLDRCARDYLGVELDKHAKGVSGEEVRRGFGKFLGRHPREIPAAYLEYLAADALATALLFRELTGRIKTLLAGAGGAWGYVSPDWLAEQSEKWGPLTHHIQLKAAAALDAVTAAGIGIDLGVRDELLKEIQGEREQLRQQLEGMGYRPGEGSSKALQERIARFAERHPEPKLERTATGKFSTDGEQLQRLADRDPFFRTLLDHRAADKLVGSFLEKLGSSRLHPSFDVLKNTGRTSSMGDINAQNLPRDDRVRRCFVPAAGHDFLDADYSTVELATLAQSVLSQFGGRSVMAEAINAGVDLHRLVAARVTGKPEAEVTAEERRRAKAINFGKPGGMGTQALREYASASYGLVMGDDEVAALEQAWFALFPEMRDFLSDEGRNPGAELASRLGLNWAEFNERARPGERSWSTPDGRHSPEPILGWMCLKVLGDRDPVSGSGKRYSEAEKDYFWERAQSLADQLGAADRERLLGRDPHPELRKAVLNLLERGPVFTLTGRLRAGASYCARRNTVFQGLAADGAKLALWALWRSGHRIVNFVHDQFLIEVPEDADLKEVRRSVEATMLCGMREVVPDIEVRASLRYCRNWGKADPAGAGDAPVTAAGP